MAEPAQYQSLMERNARSNEGGSPLRNLLSKLFQDWSMGGSVPATYGAIADKQQRAAVAPPMPYEGPMDDAAAQSMMPAQRPMQRPMQRPAAQQSPIYDPASEVIQPAAPEGIVEGVADPRNEGARARALAWALRQQGTI